MCFNNFHKVLLIVLIILIIINLIQKNINTNKNDNKIIYSEILCVGAGVANAYTCYQLKKLGISKNKIIVLEKQNIIGGRISSLSSNIYKHNKPEVAFSELGAMRLFDTTSMKKIFDLLKVFDLKTVKVSLEDKNNIFFYKNKQYNKSDVILSNGIKLKDLESYVINNIQKKYTNINFDNIFDYEEFINMNINDLFMKYGNVIQEDINIWIAYNGYDIYTNNTQISSMLIMKNFFNQSNKDLQYYLLDGMISLVKKLFENSNVQIIYNTRAINIKKDSDGYNIINTIDSNHEYKQYKCKYLFIGVTSKNLQVLNTYNQIPISSLRLKMAFESISVPLFKVFLKWDKENIWWGEGFKYKSGKSTTDLQIRQIHYYDDEDILIYNSGKYASELNNKFLENPAKASIEVYEQIKKVHQADIPPPNFVYTLFKYWPDGSHKWKIGADVNKNIKLIPNGFIDGSNIFIIGDAFSKYQGWIVGALDSADVAIKSLEQNINYNKKY